MKFTALALASSLFISNSPALDLEYIGQGKMQVAWKNLDVSNNQQSDRTLVAVVLDEKLYAMDVDLAASGSVSLCFPPGAMITVAVGTMHEGDEWFLDNTPQVVATASVPFDEMGSCWSE